MVFVKLSIMTLLPVLLSGFFLLLDRKTGFLTWKSGTKQTIIGIAFGILAILATQYGVEVEQGVLLNVRDASPLCAGLFFGGPAGLISGIIGGVYRWLSVYWGGGMLTRTACSVGTVCAGIFSALLYHSVFEGKKPGVLSAFGIGATTEVLHMLLVLATNLSDVPQAFYFVQKCSFIMILFNGVAVALAAGWWAFLGQKEDAGTRKHRLSNDFSLWLLVCVVVAFLATSGFTQQVIYRITTEETVLYRNVTLYLVVFMEILIYTALFIFVYQMLKRKVTSNLEKVNEGLKEITAGNLDTYIDVRSYKEFSDLSDDVNATVSTLKHYIQEAEDRINQELEFAWQIQHSVLPRVFPSRADIDLYANMKAAKEVGGDFYDFYPLGSSAYAFFIADVSGKGIPAAMFMMRAKTLLRASADRGCTLDEIFSYANEKLCAGNDAMMFLTAWGGKLDLSTGKLEYVNAGHNPPLIRHRNGQYEYLRSKPDFILAAMEESRYHIQTVQLLPGDSLYLYTDGVTEAANEQNELFGEDRLKQALSAVNNTTEMQSICEEVSAALKEFVQDAPQSDDITMLCVRMNAMNEKDIVTTTPDEKSFAIVQDFLSDRLEAAGVPMKIETRMQVVMDEIWSNIVNYSGAAQASLRLEREGSTLSMIFCDNGTPYDPTKVPEPDTTLSAQDRPIGGLGMHMVRKMSSKLAYVYEDGENRLSIGFDLEG